MKSFGLGMVLLGGLAFCGNAHATDSDKGHSSDETLRQALADEMARATKELHLEKTDPPYYIAYVVTDFRRTWANAEFGATTGQNSMQGRSLRVEVRVGSLKSDSGNFRDPRTFYREFPMPLALEDDYLALRRELWLRTDETYKRAIQAQVAKLGLEKRQNKGEHENVDDFTAAKSATTVHSSPAARIGADKHSLAQLVAQLSKIFRDYSDIHTSRVNGRHQVVRTRILTSDGLWKDEQSAQAQIQVHAETQADDGLEMRTWLSFEGESIPALPAQAEMEAKIRKRATELTLARNARVAEGGTAVVIFEGLCGPRLLRRLLADHLSGTPAPIVPMNPSPGMISMPGSIVPSELADKLGQRIAPAFFFAYDDPRMDRGPNNSYLFGTYRADDEAVPAARVDLIQAGILKSLYMSRTPRKEITASNGHGRGWVRSGAVRGDPGVLFVQAKGTGVPEAQLRARALKEAKASGSQVPVYLVRDFDNQARIGFEGGENEIPSPLANSPQTRSGVNPLLVYRLRPDGSEEPVRGIRFTNLVSRSLKDLVAMGKTPYVYNYLGTGDLPYSIVAPSLIFRDVEVKKDLARKPLPPLYAHPYFASDLASTKTPHSNASSSKH